jgi:DNA-directed RNA polymerase omega subunit
MSDANDLPTDDLETENAVVDDTPPGPRPRAPLIDSRFLFVDVAAMRAKQLRRGALVRLEDEDEMYDPQRPEPRKPERIAMEEVRRGLVLYEVPTSDKPPEPD